MSGILQALLAGFGAVTDEYFKYVTMLLPGNGTNGAQNNTFLDSSTNNFTITRNGNTTQGTFSPYGSNWSNYFDGNGDFLSIADNAAFTLGSGDWTIEAWVFTGASATQKVVAGQIDSSGTTLSLSFQLDMSSADYPRVIIASGTTLYIATSSSTLPKNQWVHLAGVRDGNTMRIYVNGVQTGTQGVTGVTVNDSSSNVGIGRHGQYAGLDWDGYISNLRLVKGTCVYPSGTTFTPSTAPLTAITNTSLLTCQSNRFIDNSTNAFAITVNGNTSVQRFSPFNPTAPYAAGTDGGSGYFDGSGDYLSIPDNAAFDLGSGAFTLEVWAYMADVTPSKAEWFISQWLSDTGNSWGFRVETDGTLNFFYSTDGNNATTVGTASPGLVANAWHHIAVVRSGSAVTIYVDGVSKASSVVTATFFNSSASVMIGNQAATGFGQTFTGYIASARVVKGTAVYTSTFTPPTAPLTAITNTSLLCNFTNAGIFDSAMMNNLETVGNAQVSTSVVKYGTGSMAFDGSGDWLASPANPNVQFGTGDFTVEAWVYRNGSQAQFVGLVGLSGAASAGWFLSFGASNVLTFGTASGTVITSSSALTNTAWVHVAVSRSGTSLKMFFDGVQVASATDSTSFTDNAYGVRVGGSSGYSFNGYIDDLRITKGYARYTTNFTAPTAPFPLS